MSLDLRRSIRHIDRMGARGHALQSAHWRRYVLAPVARLLASIADRKRQQVSAILDRADPDRRSDRPPRPAGIGARWHRW